MPANRTYVEHEVLSRIAAGDEQAFELLHDRYWNECFSLGMAFLKSAESAEDVVQEVFIKLWQKKEQLPHIQRFEPFFFVMLRNALISELRRQKREGRDVADYMQVSTPGASDHSMEAGETQQLVRQALEQLTPQQQRVFKMSREDGLNHQLIAEQTGLSPKTVSNTITIVLGHIRTYLYKKGNFLLSLLSIWI